MDLKHLTDEQIAAIWDSLPGIAIHNEAARNGRATEPALRVAFAKKIMESCASELIALVESQEAELVRLNRMIHVAAWRIKQDRKVDPQQVEWSNDLQSRLIEVGKDQDSDVRNIMAESACLLAVLTGEVLDAGEAPARQADALSDVQPLLYYRAESDGSICWGEDCVSHDDAYTGECDDDDEFGTRGEKAYSEAQVRAILAAAHQAAPVQLVLQARLADETAWTDIGQNVYDHAFANGLEVRTLYTAAPVQAGDENLAMLDLANRIVRNASPDEDGRLNIAYAIARYLQPDWPSAHEVVQAGQQVPEGWQLVPCNLTQAMRQAWDTAPHSDDDDKDIREAYRRMIAAAPAPGEQA